MQANIISLVLILSSIQITIHCHEGTSQLEIVFPNISLPEGATPNLCIAMKYDGHGFAVGFGRKRVPGQLTHGVLMACKEPGLMFSNWDPNSSQLSPIWNCPFTGLGNISLDERFPTGSHCSDSGRGESTIYAHGTVIQSYPDEDMGLKLPEGVGTELGGHGFDYLVLGIHFAGTVYGWTDDEIVTVDVLPAPQPGMKQPFLFSIVKHRTIKPHETEVISANYEVEEPVAMHPFFVGFHSHHHSVGYLTKVSPSGDTEMISERIPPNQELLFPVVDKNTIIREGDTIQFNCTIHNPTDKLVEANEPHSFEMCLAFMMYWEEHDVQIIDMYFEGS